MNIEIKRFLKGIIAIEDCEKVNVQHLKSEAERLLENDLKELKEKVKELWSNQLNGSYNSEDENQKNRNAFKNIKKFDFVSGIYRGEQQRLVEEYWEETDLVIEAIQEYIKELNEQDKIKETKELEEKANELSETISESNENN